MSVISTSFLPLASLRPFDFAGYAVPGADLKEVFHSKGLAFSFSFLSRRLLPCHES